MVKMIMEMIKTWKREIKTEQTVIARIPEDAELALSLLKITAAIKGLVRQKLENLDDNLLSLEALLEQL